MKVMDQLTTGRRHYLYLFISHKSTIEFHIIHYRIIYTLELLMSSTYTSFWLSWDVYGCHMVWFVTNVTSDGNGESHDMDRSLNFDRIWMGSFHVPSSTTNPSSYMSSAWYATMGPWGPMILWRCKVSTAGCYLQMLDEPSIGRKRSLT